MIPMFLRRVYGIVRWQFEGLDAFRASLAQGAGILLAANHCRRADPLVLSLLGLEVQQYFYYVVAYHQFKQSRFFGWLINRVGGYSLWREGRDFESLRVSARIMANAERPLVLFPEGTWFRQNDRLGPIQEGLSLIARQAAKQATRPIAIHPVALKYWLLEDPRPILCRRLASLEARLSWQPQDHLDLVPRIEKLASALLAIKELEHWGASQVGTLDERIQRLADSHVTLLEKKLLGRIHEEWVLKRVRRLRQVVVRQLQQTSDSSSILSAQQALEVLLFCENLCAHSHEYLLERPSLERLTETVQRLEEIVTDQIETTVAPTGVTIAVGPAIDLRRLPGGRKQESEMLVSEVADGIQRLLDHALLQGPPAAWCCPSPVKESLDAVLG
jgi:1-acyl-sn-glycerol-3-phosphate acyltransferase